MIGNQSNKTKYFELYFKLISLMILASFVFIFNTKLANAQYFNQYNYQYHYPRYIPPPYYYPVYPPYYNNYSPLRVTCNSNQSFGYNNNYITWTAYANGGSGYNYSYTWNGTDNPRSINVNSINVYYNSSGTKNMSVTVRSSDGQISSAYCGTVYINNYPYYQNYPYYPYY